MFDLITGSTERPLRQRAPGSKVASVVLHVVVATLLIGIPLLRVTNTLPEVPTIMAFVADAPAVPPPPPPPPAPAEVPAAPRPSTHSASRSPGATTAPVETPVDLKAEVPAGATPTSGAVVGGVEGGIEGGVVGGVSGGVIGGLVSTAPPPPPAAPLAPAGPVRVGGQVHTPALVHRVEPIYPDVAAAAQIGGTVILEAVVGADGCVESVKVLRSRHALLDSAATDALKQWRYTPLVLNGIPTSFVLTVTFTFSTTTTSGNWRSR